MVRFVAISALFFAAPFAMAKCVDGFYVVEGRVVDALRQPVAGALVGASWQEAGDPAGPAMATSNVRGEFTLHVHFHTFVAIGQEGDICTGKLQSVSVRAAHGDKQSIAFPVKVGHSDSVVIRPPLLVVDLPRDGSR